jgi:phage baseplate assembly protein W
MADIIGSGIAFPLRVDRRGALAVVRDEEDLHEAIRIILGTAPGERPMRPEFGCSIHDAVFDTIDAALAGRLEREVRAALARWEPRIEVISVSADFSNAEEGVLLIDIRYVLRATSSVRNLIYPFYVVPAEESR